MGAMHTFSGGHEIDLPKALAGQQPINFAPATIDAIRSILPTGDDSMPLREFESMQMSRLIPAEAKFALAFVSALCISAVVWPLVA